MRGRFSSRAGVKSPFNGAELGKNLLNCLVHLFPSDSEKSWLLVAEHLSANGYPASKIIPIDRRRV